MNLIAVELERRRVWIGGRRCHHGLVGAGLAVAGAVISGPVGPALFGLGVALIVDDWPDVPWFPSRRPTHPRGALV